MWIAPEIVARHWEAAAADQLARDLESEGYEVRREERIGDHVADLVARRGGETAVYEVKAPPWDPERASELVALRDEAVRRLGARFELVVVTPPDDVAAEVAGLADILRDRLADPVDRDLALLSERTRVDDVSGVVIASIQVRPPTIRVKGNGVVHVTLAWGRGDDTVEDRESFPLSFALSLDARGGLLDIERLEVDTSAWRVVGEGDDGVAPLPERAAS